MSEREALVVSWPGQCCDGYCIEAIGVHQVEEAEVAEHIKAQVASLLKQERVQTLEEVAYSDWLRDHDAALVAQARSEALKPVRSTVDNLLAAIDRGVYRFEDVFVTADLAMIGALIAAAAQDVPHVDR